MHKVNVLMTNMVSVVLATYNAEKYLKQNIESLINQTYKNIELIYVNDGSTDSTLNILESYSVKDSRIKIISQENAGAAIARNRGIESISGKYLMILDADDYFELNMVEELVYYAEKLQTEIVIFGSNIYDNQSGMIKEYEPSNKRRYIPNKDVFSNDDISNCLLQICGTAAWNKFYLSEYVYREKLFFQNCRIIDDVFFSVMSLCKASKVAYLDKKLLFYRVNNAASQMGDTEHLVEQYIKAYEFLITELEKEEFYYKYKKSIIKEFVEATFYAVFKNENLNVHKQNMRVIKNSVLGRVKIDEDFALVDGRFLYMLKIIQKHDDMDLVSNLVNKVTYYDAFAEELSCVSGDLVIYGAGKAGIDIVSRLLADKKYNIVAWVDKNYKSISYDLLEITSPVEIHNTKFDFIVVAIDDRLYANQAIEFLLSMKIDKSKIIWKNHYGKNVII